MRRRPRRLDRPVREEQGQRAQDERRDESAAGLERPDGQEHGRQRDEEAGDHARAGSEHSPPELGRQSHEEEGLRETGELEDERRGAPESEGERGEMAFQAAHVALAIEEDGELALEDVPPHEADDGLVGVDDAVGRDDEEEAEAQRGHQTAGEAEAGRATHPFPSSAQARAVPGPAQNPPTPGRGPSPSRSSSGFRPATRSATIRAVPNAIVHPMCPWPALR